MLKGHYALQQSILMLESKSNSFLDKDIIFAKMTIDKIKLNLKLEKSFGFDDKEKPDIHINHFKFLKFPPLLMESI